MSRGNGPKVWKHPARYPSCSHHQNPSCIVRVIRYMDLWSYANAAMQRIGNEPLFNVNLQTAAVLQRPSSSLSCTSELHGVLSAQLQHGMASHCTQPSGTHAAAASGAINSSCQDCQSKRLVNVMITHCTPQKHHQHPSVQQHFLRPDTPDKEKGLPTVLG